MATINYTAGYIKVVCKDKKNYEKIASACKENLMDFGCSHMTEERLLIEMIDEIETYNMSDHVEFFLNGIVEQVREIDSIAELSGTISWEDESYSTGEISLAGKNGDYEVSVPILRDREASVLHDKTDTKRTEEETNRDYLLVGKYYPKTKEDDEIIEKGFYRQGYIFKDGYAYEHRPWDVCYIPENSDKKYTKRDFLKLCDYDKKLADELFERCDLYHPETVIDDSIYNEEWVRCENCGKFYNAGDADQCPKCGSAFVSDDPWYFKDENAYEERPSDVCYIPEGSKRKYTKQDFLKLCEYDKKLADELFKCCDWKHPESAFDDFVYNREWVRCKECGKLYNTNDAEQCPRCETALLSDDPWYSEHWYEDDLANALKKIGAKITRENINLLKEHCMHLFDDKSSRIEMLADAAEELFDKQDKIQ